jgi:hypothetical protein
MSLTKNFCHCVKKVRRSIKLRTGQKRTKGARESAAIAVCVKSVLQTKGLTLKKVRCLPKKKARLFTQKLHK